MTRLAAACLAFAVLAVPAAADPAPCRALAAAIRSAFEADADLDRVYARLSGGPAWTAPGVAISGRRATVGRRVFRAEFAAPETEAGFAPGSTRAIALRADGRAACRLRLVGETEGRIEEMRPSDAAAEFARRQPMAALEPVLPALARARLAAPSADQAGLLGPGAESQPDGAIVFAAGGARFALSLSPVPESDGTLSGTLARLVPELGNRGRPLGTFRYVAVTRLAHIAVE